MAVSPTPVSSPTSSPTGTPEPIPNDWKTYHNTKYDFAIRYPDGWVVTAPGRGEARQATASDSQITISRNDENDGIQVGIYKFMSEDIGSDFRSARNLDEYIRVLNQDPGAKARLTFSSDAGIDGRPARWSRACLSPYDTNSGCVQRVYLQDQDFLYEITGSSYATTTASVIINSLRFPTHI